MADQVWRDRIRASGLLPEGVAGVDAGLTLTKAAWRSGDEIHLVAVATGNAAQHPGLQEAIRGASRVGVSGAKAAYSGIPGMVVPEIEAGARGVRELVRADGGAEPGVFLLAFMGTGTSFAAVRGDTVTHLGGTAMGGGSFAGIARRMQPWLTYEEMVAGAARGDRRNVDLMLTDAYPEGVGRLRGGDFTAAHFAKQGGSPDDALAALLNMHAENIAQIAAGRARAAGLERVIVAGGFAHENTALTEPLLAMVRMFGLEACVAPHAGFAGAIGAAIIAAEESGSAG